MHTFKLKFLILPVTIILVQLKTVYGQQNFLKIGDKIPNIKVNLINYPTPNAEISDFKGKLLYWIFGQPGVVHVLPTYPKWILSKGFLAIKSKFCPFPMNLLK
jgi:hypothetical protein